MAEQSQKIVGTLYFLESNKNRVFYDADQYLSAYREALDTHKAETVVPFTYADAEVKYETKKIKYEKEWQALFNKPFDNKARWLADEPLFHRCLKEVEDELIQSFPPDAGDRKVAGILYFPETNQKIGFKRADDYVSA